MLGGAACTRTAHGGAGRTGAARSGAIGAAGAQVAMTALEARAADLVQDLLSVPSDGKVQELPPDIESWTLDGALDAGFVAITQMVLLLQARGEPLVAAMIV